MKLRPFIPLIRLRFHYPNIVYLLKYIFPMNAFTLFPTEKSYVLADENPMLTVYFIPDRSKKNTNGSSLLPHTDTQTPLLCSSSNTLLHLPLLFSSFRCVRKVPACVSTSGSVQINLQIYCFQFEALIH